MVDSSDLGSNNNNGNDNNTESCLCPDSSPIDPSAIDTTIIHTSSSSTVTTKPSIMGTTAITSSVATSMTLSKRHEAGYSLTPFAQLLVLQIYILRVYAMVLQMVGFVV